MKLEKNADIQIPEIEQSWMKFEFSPCPFIIKKVEYTADTCDHTMHNHDFIQILYCCSGTFTHTIGKNVYECLKGSFSIVPPGTLHSFFVKKGTIILYIEIPYNAFENKLVGFQPCSVALTLAPNFCDDKSFYIPEHFQLSDDGQLAEEVFLYIANTGLQAKHTNKIFAAFEKLCSALFPLTNEQAVFIKKLYEAKIRPIVKALDYLNTHYASKIYHTEILRTVFLCKTDFYNYFKRFTGMTYSIYLQMVRVRRAHRAIAFTQYSLSYIANMCGFGDNAYMTKCYKKYKGYTPTEERSRRTFQRPEYSHLRITRDFFE